MKLDNTPFQASHTYYIVEDITDAATRLQHEMGQYKEWVFAGHAKGVKQARQDIAEKRPQLIFCDWDIIGGSGFEVLQHIGTLHGYHPFIIFNTGFQSDHPEIAEELVNTYKPDAYINKPYWQKLREQLDGLLQKAKLKNQQSVAGQKALWLNDQHGHKIPMDPYQINCILQSAHNPRNKIIYTTDHPKGIEIGITWNEVKTLLDENGIDHFITNKRYSVVVKKYIESYFSPMVYLKPNTLKVEIVPDYIKHFEEWLHQ
jgi:two-component system, LytTR family, response regulator